MLKRFSIFATPATLTKQLAGAGCFLLASGCLPPTERDFQLAQTINEMNTAVNEIRQLSYELQDRVDSLTMVMAKRDTVIRQLANLAGVTVPP